MKDIGQFDRQTLAAGGILLVLLAFLLPLVAGQGITLNDGIYRVGVDEDSQYYDVIQSDPTFVAVEPNRQQFQNGNIDILIRTHGPPMPAETRKGEAALSELQQTVKQYNDQQMGEEADQAAAFPVNVSLEYEDQQTETTTTSSATQQTTTIERDHTGEAQKQTTQPNSQHSQRPTPSSQNRSGDTTSDPMRENQTRSEPAPTNGSLPPSAVDGGGGSSLFTNNEREGSPSDITPPFPFESLILAFVFILPMNFVIQAYASSIMDERINNRGELLLVSPVSRGEIIVGKTLPYFLVMVGIALVTAISIGFLTPAGSQSLVTGITTVVTAVAAVVPIALLFLATAFVSAMFARSFKELTFVTVSVSVVLTAYTFIPAIFTNVHPIAAISPLTLVVTGLQGNSVSVTDYVFSGTPLYLSAGILFALGAGVYQEEDMFTQRAVSLKFLDSLDSQIGGRLSVGKLSLFSLPFVFVTELLLVAVLFALPIELSLPLLLVGIAFIEEVAKSVHIYAGFAHRRFNRSIPTIGLLGIISGTGFFLGEKATVVAQLVGLPNLELGYAAFGATTGVGASSPVVLVGLFLLPLALHTTTATITAYGASKNRNWYALLLIGATLIHAGYNLVILTHYL